MELPPDGFPPSASPRVTAPSSCDPASSETSAATDDTAMAQRFTADPFHVLTAPLSASAHDLVRRAAALLEAIARGEPGSARYPTPLGERTRDAEVVRAAIDELRDREERIVHEVWARLPVRSQPVRPPVAPGPWAACERAFGWRGR